MTLRFEAIRCDRNHGDKAHSEKACEHSSSPAQALQRIGSGILSSDIDHNCRLHHACGASIIFSERTCVSSACQQAWARSRSSEHIRASEPLLLPEHNVLTRLFERITQLPFFVSHEPLNRFGPLDEAPNVRYVTLHG